MLLDAHLLLPLVPKAFPPQTGVWQATLLAYITGTVDQELLLRNAYLGTENRVLRKQLKERAWLSDGERKTLAEIACLLQAEMP